MIVDFELDPDRKVGRIQTKQLNESILLNVDEAGNVFSVEVMSYARELYGEDPVTVLGLPALLISSPFPKSMSVEEYHARQEEIREWMENTWRGGPYRKRAGR